MYGTFDKYFDMNLCLHKLWLPDCTCKAKQHTAINTPLKYDD